MAALSAKQNAFMGTLNASATKKQAVVQRGSLQVGRDGGREPNPMRLILFSDRQCFSAHGALPDLSRGIP